jgi:hypothetical protein
MVNATNDEALVMLITISSRMMILYNRGNNMHIPKPSHAIPSCSLSNILGFPCEDGKWVKYQHVGVYICYIISHFDAAPRYKCTPISKWKFGITR